MVGLVAGIARPLPAHSNSSRALPQLTRRVADELAVEASPLLHTPRGGVTYFKSGRLFYVHRARCCAKRAVTARARWCDPSGRLALDRTSLPKAVAFVLDHTTLFLSFAFDPTPHDRSPLNVRLALDRTSLSKASALASDRATVFCVGRSRNFMIPILQGPRLP